MYWIVDPELRSTLFSLNGQDEFMFWTKPKDGEVPPDESAVLRPDQHISWRGTKPPGNADAILARVIGD